MAPGHESRTVAEPTRTAAGGGRARSPWFLIAGALTLGVLVMAAAQLLAVLVDEPMSTLTRDYQVTADVPWYTGTIAVLTNMVWAAVVACALLVAWLEPVHRRRLGALGAVVAVLAADDALLFHDAIGPQNGVPQLLVLAVYAVAAVALLAWYLVSGWNGPTPAVLLGGALLAVSVFFDEVLPGLHVVEDGAKLLGALVWLCVPALSARRAPLTG